ncbi:protein mono-ADP-ribosyltransferase PARP10 isoform X2 [Notamacropus eugenii]|uniref:protein mono-ADP-ribosyltransferase PARP10 isoform X2 n=1 Tax=Notamacropus eugenii TaxID=9315 RepID=UPI003B67D0B5
MAGLGSEVNVELRGLPHAVSDELVTLYFENQRRSGGGPLQGWQRLDSGGILTFQRPEDAQRVLAQASHVLQGTAVSVVPSPPRAPQRLLLLGLRSGTAPELLELYVESLLSTKGECRALASPRPDRVLVQLSTPLSEAVAERVLSQCHQLSDSELNIVPHYEVLEPEPEPDPKPEEGERPSPGEINSTETSAEKELRETFRKTVPMERLETTMKKPGVTVPVESSIGTVPLGKMEETRTRETPEESVTVERPGAIESLGSTVLEETMPMDRLTEPVGDTVPKKVVPEERGEEMVKAVVPKEILLPMEPGALRFLQFYYQEFLASLGEVTLCPLDGPDVTGFRLSGALEPCQAAEEFLQSLQGSIECHTLPLKHPGSARFLLGSEGQGLLKDLEAQFQCILTIEQQVVAAPNADTMELEPMDLLESPAGWAHEPPFFSSTAPDTSAIQMEEIKRFLDTLKDPDEEECPSLEMEEEELHESEEGVAVPGQTKDTLEEEAALQWALHHSLEEKSLTMWETRTLKQALMLSLLDDIEPNGSGGSDSSGRLIVHVALGQDPGELSQVLETVLRTQLREERVLGVDQSLPQAFWSRLARHHDVTVILQGNCAVFSGYGPQPSCAANHLRALMTVPLSQSHILATDSAREEVVPQVMEQQPVAAAPPELECLEESSEEFQETVQAFYSTLDSSCSKIHIIKVERVFHPQLQSQYELHKKMMAESCPQHPVERILYHGTSWQAMPDICRHGFNRSFCGRNATLYGQGVYFAVKAEISIKDRYSPPDANGHKAVFVARVLTGEYGPGHPELRVPPQRDTEQGIQRYDSAVDSTRKPSIFVIFHDTQALPIFLITCQHIPDSNRLHNDTSPSFPPTDC